MKISNKEKDYISIIIAILFFAGIIWLLTGAIFYVASLFAEYTTNQDINKYYTEEQVKLEMKYLAMWDYTEKMTDEEYSKTFFKGEICGKK